MACHHAPLIRQRLLENKTLTLDQAYSQATSLDVAQKNSAAYSHPAVHVAAVDLPSTPEDDNSLCPDVLGQKPLLANNPPLATTYSKNKFLNPHENYSTPLENIPTPKNMLTDNTPPPPHIPFHFFFIFFLPLFLHFSKKKNLRISVTRRSVFLKQLFLLCDQTRFKS